MTSGTPLFLVLMIAIALSRSIAAGAQTSLPLEDPGLPETSLHFPVYRIPLRVHLQESNRRPEAFKPILEEINEIWLTQAGICFEMQIVPDDRIADMGWDLWFMPLLHGDDLNGYYQSDHDIRVRDTPILMPAAHPARNPAARTAAHELGHGLSLIHRQDSDDNLMRSKTFGWQLNSSEVDEARRTAAKKALKDTTPMRCGEPSSLFSLGPS